jgi:hypothetical protein
LAYFTPDEIAEAFAAARGIASPTQLRTAMKSDGRDLLAQFRALAPARRPISLQTWGARRVLLAAGVAAVTALLLPNVYSLFTPTDLPIGDEPSCGTDEVMILMAQAVSTATAVPCVAALPAGWDVGGVRVRRGDGRFWLNSDQAGDHAVEVTLRPPDECTVEGATEVPSDEVGMRRYEQPEQLPPGLRSTRTYVFDGGCVTYEFNFDAEATAALMFDADSALAFQPRDALVAEVRDTTGLRLCGRGAAPCPGS